MGRRGFTLLEIIIVVVILTILFSFGLTNYSKTLYEGRKKIAANNKELIEKSLKIHYINTESDLEAELIGEDAINNALDTRIKDSFFEYSVDASGNVTVTDNKGNVVIFNN